MFDRTTFQDQHKPLAVRREYDRLDIFNMVLEGLYLAGTAIVRSGSGRLSETVDELSVAGVYGHLGRKMPGARGVSPCGSESDGATQFNYVPIRPSWR